MHAAQQSKHSVGCLLVRQLPQLHRELLVLRRGEVCGAARPLRAPLWLRLRLLRLRLLLWSLLLRLRLLLWSLLLRSRLLRSLLRLLLIDSADLQGDIGRRTLQRLLQQRAKPVMQHLAHMPRRRQRRQLACGGCRSVLLLLLWLLLLLLLLLRSLILGNAAGEQAIKQRVGGGTGHCVLLPESVELIHGRAGDERR